MKSVGFRETLIIRVILFRGCNLFSMTTYEFNTTRNKVISCSHYVQSSAFLKSVVDNEIHTLTEQMCMILFLDIFNLDIYYADVMSVVSYMFMFGSAGLTLQTRNQKFFRAGEFSWN